MAKIRTSWKVDNIVSRIVIGEMSEKIFDMLKVNPSIENVLDVGGGRGWFSRKLREKRPEIGVYVVDIALPNRPFDDVEYIRGDALRLPVGDESFDAVTAHAILHHLPENLDGVMEEIDRVLKPGGVLLVEEPGGENFLGNLAREYITTERHDPDEKPLPLESMLVPISKHLEISEVEPYLYLSYLLPHISSRVPEPLLPFMRWFSRGIYRLDKGLVAGKMGEKAAYFVIIARKNRTVED